MTEAEPARPRAGVFLTFWTTVPTLLDRRSLPVRGSIMAARAADGGFHVPLPPYTRN
jgi:hypothetical protein